MATHTTKCRCGAVFKTDLPFTSVDTVDHVGRCIKCTTKKRKRKSGGKVK